MVNSIAPNNKHQENPPGLYNKRIVVLGGSSGIGLEVARQALVQGAKTVIASSNSGRVARAISDLDNKAEGHTLNLSDQQAVQDLFDKLGVFDHLVFTAGDTLQLTYLADVDLQKARNAFEMRYWAALAAVKYASAHIRKGGSIVLTTGIAGARPQKGWAVAASGRTSVNQRVSASAAWQ